MLGYPYLRLKSAFQGLDEDLDSIALLGTAANKMLYTTAENTWTEADLTSAGRALLDDANAGVQRTTLGLAIGTNVQAFGDVLDDLNTLSAPASDGQFIVATGAGAFQYEATTVARTSLGVGEGDTPTLTGLTLVGNNATLKVEDDSGNYSIVKTGNSQLTISADPDDAVASTDIVFEIDGVEVGRFQEGLGLQSVKGFATQLWDVAGANWETAAINTEYYSPNQCGGIYGTIYRQYFTTALTSTNPRLDSGGIVTKMVDYVFHTKYTGNDRGVGHGNMTAYGSSDNHAYLMLSGASGGGNLSFALDGYSIITGWVDYTRS